ncbi:MAG TPA: hypothetical protein VNO31_42330 [Umezawaea sp.]|nr:hypothetical protein [Umezawaea sp.]
MGAVETVAAASGGIWDHYRDERGVPVVRLEMHSAGSPGPERAMILAELKRLLKAAKEGRLKPHLDIRHIQRNRLIYELRLNFDADERPLGQRAPEQLWRLYFGWHSNRGPLRLALKFGGKPSGHDGLTTQNRHIDEAGHRYKAWLSREENR